ncbi:MAG: elongation factor G [Chloroflexi bacterium]|nr:elongation factor G [Chloroflexota bacterium]
MKRYATERIRNIGLFGHGASGKTSLTEALLFASKAITRLGRVEEGNTTSDYDPDEVRRRVSISVAVAPIEWRDHKLNIIDAPGYADFVGDMVSAARIADAAVVLLDASAGVEVGTEQAWAACTRAGCARLLYINKMDRENADFGAALDSARRILGANLVPLQVPIGKETGFKGIVDILQRTAYLASGNRDGVSTEAEVPADLAAEVDRYRELLVEKVAETDDALIEKYLEGETIADDELSAALAAGIRAGQLVPVLCGSATLVAGMTHLLDTLIALAPSPAQAQPITATNPTTGKVETLIADPAAPLAALVFKTLETQFGRQTYIRVFSGTLASNSHVLNASRGRDERVGQLQTARGKELQPIDAVPAGDIGMVTKLADTLTGDTLSATDHPLVLPGIEFPTTVYEAAIVPRSKTDLDKLGPALAKMLTEDPVLRSRRSDAAETIVAGMGESHIQVVGERMARKFGVNVDAHLPMVPYRETISAPARRVEYRHKKQTGGAGQFGHVVLDLEPLPDKDFEFAETIFGGSVPRQYIPGVEKGVREAVHEGPLAGYPLQNIKIILTDGSYHDVDSSEIAFKIAASQAVKKGALQARPVLLEPVMKVEIDIPESYMGDIMSDLNTKRGQVLGMNPAETGITTIEAMVPLAEIQRYATDLRAITQGRGTFRMAFDHYQTVPPHVADAVIAAARKARDDGG